MDSRAKSSVVEGIATTLLRSGYGEWQNPTTGVASFRGLHVPPPVSLSERNMSAAVACFSFDSICPSSARASLVRSPSYSGPSRWGMDASSRRSMSGSSWTGMGGAMSSPFVPGFLS